MLNLFKEKKKDMQLDVNLLNEANKKKNKIIIDLFFKKKKNFFFI